MLLLYVLEYTYTRVSELADDEQEQVDEHHRQGDPAQYELFGRIGLEYIG